MGSRSSGRRAERAGKLPGKAPRELIDRWLPHLNRDRRGLPVPYVNQWGVPPVSAAFAAYDPYVERRGLYVPDWEGGPDFTKQAPQRQRQCMVSGVCQVCARPVPWTDRYLVLSSVSVSQIEHGGRMMPVVKEPWLCQICAHIATTWCPALVRQKPGVELWLIPVTSPEQVVLMMSTGTVGDDLRTDVPEDEQVVLYVNLALPGVDIQLVDR